MSLLTVSLAGFFRRYELYYVFADERDVIRDVTGFGSWSMFSLRTPSWKSLSPELQLPAARSAMMLFSGN